jgi:hypothetical protein
MACIFLQQFERAAIWIKSLKNVTLVSAVVITGTRRDVEETVDVILGVGRFGTASKNWTLDCASFFWIHILQACVLLLGLRVLLQISGPYLPPDLTSRSLHPKSHRSALGRFAACLSHCIHPEPFAAARIQAPLLSVVQALDS